MNTKANFYHARCPVCIEFEQQFAESLDPTSFNVAIVHLGDAKDRLSETKAEGV